MTSTATKINFGKNIGFKAELNRRVEDYFQSQQISLKGNLTMYVKTLVILGWLFSVWGAIVFLPSPLWVKALECIVLGFAIGGVGFSVGHDANHSSYSHHHWVNRLISLTYDFIGLSSYLWRFRHNRLHHVYTNILEHDVEIHGDGLVRMSPGIEHRWFHQFQHWFIWFIYTVIPWYWSLCDVHLILFKRKYHNHDIPQPKPLDLAILLGSKVVWLGFFVGIPLLAGYTLLQTMIGFGIAYMTYGLLICTTFMLNHVVEDVDFFDLEPGEKLLDEEWAIWQVKTSADYCHNNPLINWYVGGLNYQIVHHLFPHICHTHYPKIAPIVMEVCREYGIKYMVYDSLWEALSSNYRYLQKMGAKPELVLSN